MVSSGSLLERRWTPYILVALVPFVVSLPRFWNGFVFDDVFVIQRGTFIHQLQNLPTAFRAHTMVASTLDAAVGKPAMDTYRPLTLLTFFWDAWLSGRRPWSYELTNALLHAAVCLLFYQTLRSLLNTRTKIPLLLALCFGLSPWLAEAHVWINGRSDLLIALFVLLAFLWQRRALSEQTILPALGAGVCSLCALLCKETAVIALPFIVLVPTFARAPFLRRSLYATPQLVAFGIYMLMRTLALDGLRTNSGTGQLMSAFYNLPLLLWDGLLHALIPTPFVLRNLRDDYAAVPSWLEPLSMIASLLLGASVLWLTRRLPVLLWALVFACATLAPAMMITTELWPGFGRYLYLPAMGAFCALGALLCQLTVERPSLSRLTALVLITLAGASGALLVDATLSLRDERTVYTRAFARAPTQAWTIGFLGLSRKRDGHCDEAVPLLAVAAKLALDEPRYAVQLARCLLELQQFEQAAAVAREGRERFRDTRAEAGFLMAEFLSLRSNSREQATEILARCIEVDPTRSDCAEAMTLVGE